MRHFRHKILEDRTLDGKYRAFSEEPLPIASLLDKVQKVPQSRENIFYLFQPIFFCFRNPSPNDSFCMELMLEAIKNGTLLFEIEFISTPPNIDESLQNTGRGRGRIVESAEHKGMKRWIRKHLSTKGIPVANGEVSVLGYEVDVGCVMENVYVECGDTEPRKIFEFLRNGMNIGVFQYNAEEIIWFYSSKEFIKFAKEKSSGFLT